MNKDNRNELTNRLTREKRTDGDFLDYDSLATRAYKAPINAEGVAVLPADWDDEDPDQ